ncbi:MAG: aminotransferase class I/II-fold pyridoxal phosphate-dependent enzyme [Pseudomonadota bacterium]
MKPFEGSFTQQEAIPVEGVVAAVDVMRSGRLHRYNTVGDELGPVAELERAYAAYQGSDYCLACSSGGAAMAISLRAAGVTPGDKVLTNAFTLAPVPGAIAAVGAEAVLVEITDDLVVDLKDLERKIASSGAGFFLLSNMRGHLCNMEALSGLLEVADIKMIEDCAHTMGARWNGRLSGGFGLAGCFSTQTYKHLNSGEGGLITSNDAEFMARAIILSGSYMLYERHGAGPAQEVFSEIRLDTPNMSARMDNVRAAMLLPQLEKLEDNIRRWNERYDAIAARLSPLPGVVLPERPDEESYVGSSIQFRLPDITATDAGDFMKRLKTLGVEVKWFGDKNPVAFTSSHHSWRYVAPQNLPETDRILSGLFDMRIPLTFSLADCEHIAAIIAHVVEDRSLRGAA